MNFRIPKCYKLNEGVPQSHGFEPKLEGVNLHKINEQVPKLKTFEKMSGVYFWVLRRDGCRYKIYIGRTNDLSKRVKDYTRKFQPHSPNDYKLRFFQELLGGKFDLYFLGVEDKKQCVRKETDVIKRLQPLINDLPKAIKLLKENPQKKDEWCGATKKLEKAFCDYYASVLKLASDEGQA
jgi:predicted GIY-YIG superfamily endonuclease